MEQEEVWVKIPGSHERYEISNLGRVRAWYKYEGHTQRSHFKVLKPDGNNVRLQERKKYNIPLLMQQLFGLTYCDDLEGEKWSDVKGFEHLYQVSNQGRIRSKPKNVLGKHGKSFYQHERILKGCRINSGYYVVTLHDGNAHKRYLVHRLVAEHFIPNPGGLKEVNHKNEDKLDNRADNLEWCDKVYNSLYGTCQERRIQTRLMNNNGKYGVPRKNTRSAGIKE